MKKWLVNLSERARKVHSQGGQDGILETIFENIGTKNSPPFCVEFGFNNTEFLGGTGPNVANLVLNKGWKCLLLDGANENIKINLHKHYLTSDNICKLFKKYKVPTEPDYVSIDVDSTDLWLFKAVLGEYRPRVVSVEYNVNYPLDVAITFPNDPNERWELDRGYGSSLKALKMVGDEYEYSIVAMVKTLDVFFIRSDLLDDGTNNIAPEFKTWESFVRFPCHPPLIRPERAEIFVDYEEYVKTNGDLEKSQKKATPICKAILC